MRTEEAVQESGLDLIGDESMAGIRQGTSFSGGERDVLFVQDADGNYQDLALISGANHPGDGRMVVRADFDRDGFADLAMTNSNAPFFRLFRNQVGQQEQAAGGFVALSLEGGNTSPGPVLGLSPRTPIGARVEYDLAGRTVVRELRAGEGMGAHNSAVMLLGLGQELRAERLRIHWPSGRTSEVGTLDAGLLVHYSETQGLLSEEPYRAETPSRLAVHDQEPHALFADQLAGTGETPARLNVFVFMGTWCSQCKAGADPLRELLDRASDLDVAAFGLSEHRGTKDDIVSYLEETQAPYPIAALDPAGVGQIKDLCDKSWLQYAVPLYILTDAEGRVLEVQRSLPSLSQLRATSSALPVDPAPPVTVATR